MKIDNFDSIIKYIKNNPKRTDIEGEDYYFVQIITRKKDGHLQNGNNRTRVIKSYAVYNAEYLEEKKDEIITFCDYFNARAYIHITRRNDEEIMKKLFEHLPMYYFQRQYRKLNSMFSSLSGVSYVRGDKTFLIDLDEGITDTTPYKEYMKSEFNLEPLLELPTVNGKHLIYRPFNVKSFKGKFPELDDVQKNNPTLLYYNKIN